MDNNPLLHCPVCGGGDLQRIRRRSAERLVPFPLLLCLDCTARFYDAPRVVRAVAAWVHLPAV